MVIDCVSPPLGAMLCSPVCKVCRKADPSYHQEMRDGPGGADLHVIVLHCDCRPRPEAVVDMRLVFSAGSAAAMMGMFKDALLVVLEETQFWEDFN